MTERLDADDGDEQHTTMSRRSYLGASGSVLAAAVGLGAGDGDDGRDDVQATMGYERGVLRVAATGVREDQDLRLTFTACGETWTLVRSVTEYRSGEWRHIGDVDKSGIAHERWAEARLVDVEVTEVEG